MKTNDNTYDQGCWEGCKRISQAWKRRRVEETT